MSARRPSRRGVPLVAVAVAVVLVVGSGAAGFVVGGGWSPSDAVTLPSASTPSTPNTLSATPTPAPSIEVETVAVPATCTESYPSSLVERDQSGWLRADPAEGVESRVRSADIAARLAPLDGLRCRWDYSGDGVGGSKIDSAVVAIPTGVTTDLVALLRASGGSCAIVRSGVLCVMPRVVGEDEITSDLETHFIRDGLWTVHVGDEDTLEYAAAMNDLLYGEVRLTVPES